MAEPKKVTLVFGGAGLTIVGLLLGLGAPENLRPGFSASASPTNEREMGSIFEKMNAISEGIKRIEANQKEDRQYAFGLFTSLDSRVNEHSRTLQGINEELAEWRGRFDRPPGGP